MAGEVASLLLSRMTVPLLYYSLRSHQEKRARMESEGASCYVEPHGEPEVSGA